MSQIDEIQKQAFNQAFDNLERNQRRLVKAYVAAREKVIKRAMNFENLWDTPAGQAAGLQGATELFNQLSGEIEEITGIRQKEIANDFYKTFDDTYYRQAYGMEQQINISQLIDNAGTGQRWSIGYSILPKNAAESALSEKIGDYTFQERGELERQIFQERLRDKLAGSIAAGESIDDAAGIIRDEFDMSIGRATTTARTEILRSYSYGQDRATKEAVDKGIEINYIWDATLDSKTRPDHQFMDQKSAEVVGGEPLFTLPDGSQASGPRMAGLPASQSINCRCRRVDRPAGLKPGPRIAKVEGKWQRVGEIDYDDWKNGLKDIPI